MGNELHAIWNNVGSQSRAPMRASNSRFRKEMSVMHMKHRRPLALRTKLASAILALGVAWSAAPFAHAQSGRGSMATLFVPDFLPRDLPVFVDALGLEEWQRPILEALLEDYGTNFATAADGVRSRMGQLKDVAAGTNPEKIVEMISAPLISWKDEKQKLRDDFLSSVRSQLSDVQAEAWPRLERALRREKSLPNGSISGESLNLVMIVREVDVPPIVADAARPIVEDYEVKLDQALAARDAADEGSIAARLQSLNDNSKFVAAEERVMQLRIAVRNAQDQGLIAIRDALGADYGPKFELRALRRAFPQVYGPDPLTPLFEAALALPDLTEEQKTKVNELRARFDSEHGALQKRYAEAIRTSEPKEPRRRAEALAIKAAGGNPNFGEGAEVDSVKLERQEMFTRFRASLAEILNDAQKELVPGFGKPGADLAKGQKYNDAVHLGSGGSESGGKSATPVLGGNEDAGDPAVKPKGGSRPSMNDTKPAGSQPNNAPKKAE